MSIKHVIAAAALLATGSAFAGAQADFAWGQTLSQGTTYGDKHAGVLQIDAGWRFDNNVALEYVNFSEIALFRNFLVVDPAQAQYGFDRFIGARAVGYLPLDKHFELMGGLGAGRSTLNNGIVGAPDRKNTDALLSAGIQWRAAPHFNVGLDANYLTKTQVSTLMLHGQVAF